MQNNEFHQLDELQKEACEREPYNAEIAAEVAATSVGCSVVYPKDNELQIDIDTEEAFLQFERRMQEFKEAFTVVRVRVAPSKSGLPHRHITVTLDGPIEDPIERIAYQFFLGSDRNREEMSLLRLFRGGVSPTRFFEPKTEVAFA